MKIRVSLAAAGLLSTVAVVGGFSASAAADSQADCDSSKPVSIYTDGLQHYAGACVEGVGYVQVNEVAGTSTLVEAGQDDNMLPTVPAPVTSSDQCPEPGSDDFVIFTDGLNTVLGACFAGQEVTVRNVEGNLTGQNPVVEVDSDFLYLSAALQSDDGTNLVVIHPRIVIVPGGR